MHSEFLKLAGANAWSRGVLVVAAHPDDETIGAGGVMPGLPRLAIAHVTDGAPDDRRWWGVPLLAPRERYADVRRAELECALALAGTGMERVRTLGRRDQRASLDLAGLAEDVARLVGAERPGVVLTRAYEGGHPDHDATAFAVHAARHLLDAEAPAVVEFTSYHAGEDGIATGVFRPYRAAHPEGDVADWPAPSRDGVQRRIRGGRAPGESGRCDGEARIPLSRNDRNRKRRMLAYFGTQAATLAQFSVGDAERFRNAPDYDFTRPPHGGTLYYERFDWGITGMEWRRLAAGALDALGIGAARC